MKKNIFFLLVSLLSAAMLTSCLEKTVDNRTPILQVSIFTNQHGDTLRISKDNDGNNYLDTIQMGDTVKYAIRFTSYYNDMLHANVEFDTLSLAASTTYPEGIDAYLKSSSRPELLRLDFDEKSNINILVLSPVRMTPKKTGRSLVTFYVQSNAQDVPNTYSVPLYVTAIDTTMVL